ncbi:ATP-binding protein [Kitasatospora sp. NPDC085895]|uniref:ATP-binding protein n=1 Tax=Kitasatospora sp. NPDC085895 TaxID=3155057 RepID=UPI00344DC7F6
MERARRGRRERPSSTCSSTVMCPSLAATAHRRLAFPPGERGAAVRRGIDFVRRTLAHWRPGTEAAAVDDVLLVAAELITNAVDHAGGPVAVELWLAVRGGRLRIDVTDTSPAEPPDPSRRAGGAAPPRPAHRRPHRPRLGPPPRGGGQDGLGRAPPAVTAARHDDTAGAVAPGFRRPDREGRRHPPGRPDPGTGRLPGDDDSTAPPAVLPAAGRLRQVGGRSPCSRTVR